MAICVGYFQGRENADAPHMFTVSGYVSSKPRWREFEIQWSRALRHEDLASFNAHDFRHRTGEFRSGWDDPSRRRRLISTLAAITDHHIFRAFACSLRIDDYDAINEEYFFNDGAAGVYGLCASVLTGNVRRWMAERHPDDLTLLVFEEGDLDPREMRRLTAAQQCERGEPPQVWPRQWVDDIGRRRYLRPLEACDLLATDVDCSLTTRLHERSRISRDVIGRDRLLQICRALGIERRFDRTAQTAG